MKTRDETKSVSTSSGGMEGPRNEMGIKQIIAHKTT